MKKLYSRSLMIALFGCAATVPYCQNVAINATGNQADPSAMLDVSSQTAGVLIPRMNTGARNAISHPATGLQIFNTDCDELNYWSGTCWISLGALPSPGPITSNSSTALCAAVTATYSVPAVMGATKYIWSVPAGAAINSGQGTTSISVTLGNYSGQICVIASDTCESSNQVCIDINVSPIPPTPGNITGLASVAPGQNLVTYFIASVTGAGVYNWSVPSGASITAGVGTPAITVDYSCSAVSGNVSVTAGSNCGTSSPAALYITVTPLSINAGPAVFGGTNIGGAPTASGGQTPYTYSWSPNSNLSSSTVANPSALCSGATTTYTVNVTDFNGCSATNSVVVTRNLTANPGSPVFGGGTLSGSATGGVSPYTYSWTPNNNLSNYTVANPTALCSGSTTTYTLTVMDAHGCTATSSVVVTRNLTANAGSSIIIGATLSGSATGGVSPYTYSWSPNNNLSSYTVSNPTALCSGSTNTYTLMVNDANGCTATSSVVVTSNLAASAGSNTSVCTGNSSPFSIGGSPTATGGNSNSYTYSWNPVTTLSSTTIANPTANPTSTTTYTVTVTDASGCTATSSMTATVSSGTHGTQTFSYSGSIVNWTIPSCISSITIQALGAQGGWTSSSTNGGLGASMTGTFSVTPGQVLSILVGQSPGNVSTQNGPGGGGGTFVALGASYSSASPLIVAGGGGGGNGTQGNGAPTSTSGTGPDPGTNGNGAPSVFCGGGGGGFYSSGGGDTYDQPSTAGGRGFQQGGAGGVFSGYQTGGFGGGSAGDGNGSCNSYVGNGGGYSGGSGFPSGAGNEVGYAGGSYNGGTNQNNVAANNSGNGQVTINY